MSGKLTSYLLAGLITVCLFVSLGLGQTGDNSPDANVNLAAMNDAILSGSVAEGVGRGIPSDIVWDPQTNDYVSISDWHEYGFAFDSTVGGITPENPFYWQVEWPTAKNINYITCAGPYGNQPQPHTGWVVQIDSAGVWKNLAKAHNGWDADTLRGIGGWVDDGLLEWKGIEPVVTTKLRICAYPNPDSLADSDTTFADSLWSFVFTGRKVSASSAHATMIQYLDFSSEPAKNRMDESVNLGLLDEAVVSGSHKNGEVQNLRGQPADLLWDPKTGDFHNPNTPWGEFGDPWQYDAGYLTHDNPWYWMVEWATPKNVNYVTWGGSYGNQPQVFTPWALEYWDGAAWQEITSGFGTDRDAGYWQLDSKGNPVDFWGIGVDSTTNSIWKSDTPVTTTKIRLAVWSDGIDPLFSYTLRGRGGQTMNWDEREYIDGYQPGSDNVLAGADSIPTTFRAILVQYKDIQTAIGTSDNAQKPAKFSLNQNYPNPFNPETTIEYNLTESGQVSLIIYNVLGQQVATVVNENQSAGVKTVTFNANFLSSGIYYYQLKTKEGVITKKMMLLK